jgi:hypothetical protein
LTSNATVLNGEPGTEPAAPAVTQIAPQALLSQMLNGSTLDEWPLYAGQTMQVGTVKASLSGTVVTVTYQMSEPGWCLSATHLYVGNIAPPSSAPGQFPFSNSNLGCTQSDTYTVRLDGSSTPLYIAAHAEVKHWSIPVGATMNYSVAFPGTNAYFNATLAGQTYPAYCVDLGRTIASNTPYQCTIYSSEDPNLPTDAVDKPGNLDLVNYVNTQYDAATQTYTKGDGAKITPVNYKAVQGAIWKLIDTSGNCDTSLGSISWDKNQCNAIVADANGYGDGFVPGPGDKIKFLVYCPGSQTTAIYQVVGIDTEFDGAYLGKETAWALDKTPAKDYCSWKNGRDKCLGWGQYIKVQ